MRAHTTREPTRINQQYLWTIPPHTHTSKTLTLTHSHILYPHTSYALTLTDHPHTHTHDATLGNRWHPPWHPAPWWHHGWHHGIPPGHAKPPVSDGLRRWRFESPRAPRSSRWRPDQAALPAAIRVIKLLQPRQQLGHHLWVLGSHVVFLEHICFQIKKHGPSTQVVRLGRHLTRQRGARQVVWPAR